MRRVENSVRQSLSSRTRHIGNPSLAISVPFPFHIFFLLQVSPYFPDALDMAAAALGAPLPILGGFDGAASSRRFYQFMGMANQGVGMTTTTPNTIGTYQRDYASVGSAFAETGQVYVFPTVMVAGIIRTIGIGVMQTLMPIVINNNVRYFVQLIDTNLDLLRRMESQGLPSFVREKIGMQKFESGGYKGGVMMELQYMNTPHGRSVLSTKLLHLIVMTWMTIDTHAMVALHEYATENTRRIIVTNQKINPIRAKAAADVQRMGFLGAHKPLTNLKTLLSRAHMVDNRYDRFVLAPYVTVDNSPSTGGERVDYPVTLSENGMYIERTTSTVIRNVVNFETPSGPVLMVKEPVLARGEDVNIPPSMANRATIASYFLSDNPGMEPDDNTRPGAIQIRHATSDSFSYKAFDPIDCLVPFYYDKETGKPTDLHHEFAMKIRNGEISGYPITNLDPNEVSENQYSLSSGKADGVNAWKDPFLNENMGQVNVPLAIGDFDSATFGTHDLHEAARKVSRIMNINADSISELIDLCDMIDNSTFGPNYPTFLQQIAARNEPSTRYGDTFIVQSATSLGTRPGRNAQPGLPGWSTMIALRTIATWSDGADELTTIIRRTKDVLFRLDSVLIPALRAAFPNSLLLDQNQTPLWYGNKLTPYSRLLEVVLKHYRGLSIDGCVFAAVGGGNESGLPELAKSVQASGVLNSIYLANNQPLQDRIAQIFEGDSDAASHFLSTLLIYAQRLNDDPDNGLSEEAVMTKINKILAYVSAGERRIKSTVKKTKEDMETTGSLEAIFNLSSIEKQVLGDDDNLINLVNAQLNDITDIRTQNALVEEDVQIGGVDVTFVQLPIRLVKKFQGKLGQTTGLYAGDPASRYARPISAAASGDDAIDFARPLPLKGNSPVLHGVNASLAISAHRVTGSIGSFATPLKGVHDGASQFDDLDYGFTGPWRRRLAYAKTIHTPVELLTYLSLLYSTNELSTFRALYTRGRVSLFRTFLYAGRQTLDTLPAYLFSAQRNAFAHMVSPITIGQDTAQVDSKFEASVFVRDVVVRSKHEHSMIIPNFFAYGMGGGWTANVATELTHLSGSTIGYGDVLSFPVPNDFNPDGDINIVPNGPSGSGMQEVARKNIHPSSVFIKYLIEKASGRQSSGFGHEEENPIKMNLTAGEGAVIPHTSRGWGEIRPGSGLLGDAGLNRHGMQRVLSGGHGLLPTGGPIGAVLL